jgi:hypothetical protein
MNPRPLLRAALVAVAVVALAAGACRKREQTATQTTPDTSAPATVPTAEPAASVRVTDVQLGSSLAADKKVTAPTDTFSPKDTIFASVATEGSGSTTLRAKWTFQDGQTVKEDSRTISPSGNAQTEFSIQKPDGWPKGNYKVEISADGQPAVAKDFKIQ